MLLLKLNRRFGSESEIYIRPAFCAAHGRVFEAERDWLNVPVDLVTRIGRAYGRRGRQIEAVIEAESPHRIGRKASQALSPSVAEYSVDSKGRAGSNILHSEHCALGSVFAAHNFNQRPEGCM